jgi:hypothetical protein
VTDEAPAGGIDQENPQIEEPEAAATGETAGTEEATTATAGTPGDATATAAEVTSTAAPATSTPAPSATIAALPSVTSIPSPPPAGIATAMDSGSDLGLFVGLAALVVASIGTAVALVALVRRRGAS